MNKRNLWIIKVFFLTFIISLIFSGSANLIFKNSNIYILVIVLIITIFIGIIFDIIGTSVLSSDESIFHAKSSKKIKGSHEAVYLIKNSEKISNFCNDIIGDICGIVSGSLSAVLSIIVSEKLKLDSTLCTLIICALVSSITVGGKAIGKSYSIKNADKIIFIVGKVLNKGKRKRKRKKRKN